MKKSLDIKHNPLRKTFRLEKINVGLKKDLEQSGRLRMKLDKFAAYNRLMMLKKKDNKNSRW